MTKPKRLRAKTRDENNQLHKLTRMPFTDLGIRNLNVSKRLAEINKLREKQGLSKLNQVQIWDTAQKGLSLLISSGGTKTFRATFKVNGKWVATELGRFGELVEDDGEQHQDRNIQIAEARRLTANYRGAHKKGIDPRPSPTIQTNERAGPKSTYADVVDDFITHYAKPRQHTWDQTQRILRSCTPLLNMPFADIKARDVEQLLHSYTIAEKHGKAAITFRWLKTLWKWAWRGDLVQQNEMQRVRFEQVTGERERVYTDAEIKAIWKAADRLDPMESGYIKLLILLAPRKTALALCRHPDLHLSDDIPIWTTPYELTKVKKSAKGKKKRTYVTPLPPLAQRILKGVPKRHDTLVFPGLRIRHSIADRATVYSHAIRRQLIKSGAPKDFTFHAMRHTLATWFEEQKYSEWERGLVLNHSGSGSVTARYSHGRIGPLEIKLEMLTAWADHVEKLIQPKGARVLR